MQWDGKIGPAFIVAVGLVVAQGANWVSESRVDLSGRLIKLETQMVYLFGIADRVEKKIDAVAVKK